MVGGLNDQPTLRSCWRYQSEHSRDRLAAPVVVKKMGLSQCRGSLHFARTLRQDSQTVVLRRDDWNSENDTHTVLGHWTFWYTFFKNVFAGLNYLHSQ